jgi:predicted RND superfamily exporter protein
MSKTPNWKTRAETGFGSMGILVSRHPWFWLLGVILLTASLAAQLKNLHTDTSVEGFLSADSPAIKHYDEFRRQFGRDEIFMVTIEVDELFESGFIETLREFHETLENTVPYVDTVDSLINARHTYGRDDELVIEDLLEDELPTDPVKLQQIKDYTYSNPQYESYLISRDHKLVTVVVKLLPFLTEEDDEGNITRRTRSDVQLGESDQAIRKVISSFNNRFAGEVQLSGSPAVGIALGTAVKTDFGVFTGMALSIIAAVLAVVFRRASGVLMPLFVMILGLTATISTMAIFNTPIQMTTSMLPSFLLAVCVGYAIHLLTIFYQHYDQGAEKPEALSKAMEHTGLAIFFTSITTAAGLGSFSWSELAPVASIGIYGAIGALLAFFYTIFLLPSLIMIFPIKRKKPTSANTRKENEAARFNLLNTVIDACIKLATKSPVVVSASGIALFILTISLALQLEFTHNSLLWFPEDHHVRKALEKSEARMGGTLPIEIIVDTGEPGKALEPELLYKIEHSIAEISQWKFDNVRVAKALSVNDIIRETNQALNANDPAHYIVPANRDLIRQELFMVELDASDDLFLLVDPNYQTLRVTLFVPWLDAVEYQEFIHELRKHFSEKYNENIEVTGLTVILAQTFAEMLFSTAQSYALAGAVIAMMMVILMGGLRIGLISMLPNLLPITLVLALMKISGVPLDAFTLLIGSIAIGLTVDDTVHFMHGFKREYAKHHDPVKAIYDTLHTTGRAMLVTTIVLSFGFLVYTQSVLENLFNFGVLTALCITFALLADFLFAPALMMVLSKHTKGILEKPSS